MTTEEAFPDELIRDQIGTPTFADDLDAAEAALADYRRIRAENPTLSETVYETLPEMPQFPELPELSEVLTADFDAGFVLRPGDTLLVSTQGQLSNDQAQRIRERLLERLPKLADVIVMPGLTVQAVYRDDKDET